MHLTNSFLYRDDRSGRSPATVTTRNEEGAVNANAVASPPQQYLGL